MGNHKKKYKKEIPGFIMLITYKTFWNSRKNNSTSLKMLIPLINVNPDFSPILIFFLKVHVLTNFFRFFFPFRMLKMVSQHIMFNWTNVYKAEANSGSMNKENKVIYLSPFELSFVISYIQIIGQCCLQIAIVRISEGTPGLFIVMF